MNFFERFVYWMPLTVVLFVALVVHTVFFLLIWTTVVATWHVLDYLVGAAIVLADLYAARLMWRMYGKNRKS